MYGSGLWPIIFTRLKTLMVLNALYVWKGRKEKRWNIRDLCKSFTPGSSLHSKASSRKKEPDGDPPLCGFEWSFLRPRISLAGHTCVSASISGKGWATQSAWVTRFSMRLWTYISDKFQGCCSWKHRNHAFWTNDLEHNVSQLRSSSGGKQGLVDLQLLA